jgi:hypothetical protein
MPEQRDHGKNITRTSSIEPLAKLLILRLHDVLTMDTGHSYDRCLYRHTETNRLANTGPDKQKKANHGEFDP